MSLKVAQMRIDRELRAAEEALDTALLRQSTLLATMIEARQGAQSDPFIGQEALLRLTRSHQTLISAGNDLARVHANLQQVQSDVLDTEDCPLGDPMGPRADLRAAS
jgi:hypothetical protein